MTAAAAPAPIPTVRGLWACFWLLVLSVVLWRVAGPQDTPAGQAGPLVLALLMLPVWFLVARLAAWVRFVVRGESQGQDVRPVQRWRVALLVFYALATVGALGSGFDPLFRIGLAVMGVTMLAVLWLSGRVIVAVQATGTAEAAAAPDQSHGLPAWTMAVRAAQVGQLVYALCADPTFSVAGVASNLLANGAIAGLLEVLLRFVRSRIGHQAD